MAREVEIKVALSSDEAADRIMTVAVGLGFRQADERSELDFVPDTPDFSCRRAGLLLRFREIRRPGTKPELLITLKIKNVEITDIQDSEEIEFLIGDLKATDTLERINSVLEAAIAIKLPETVLKFDHFELVYSMVSRLGLTARRALVEKLRRTLVRDGCTISFDTFPEPVGRYLELETPTPDALHGLIKELRLADAQLDARYYGQIVREKQADHPESERSTCLFQETYEAIGLRSAVD